MRRTSETSERLTDPRRVGQAPPADLLTLDGQRYMTPAEAWALLRTDIRGFLELLRAGRLFDRPESRAEHQRIGSDVLRRLAGRCALFLHWYYANPGVALAAWDRTVQRVIEAFAEVMTGGTSVSTQDAVRAAMSLFAEERELAPRLSPRASAELAAREARIADQAEALTRGAEGASGLTPRASEQIQALARPFALWQTPEMLAADQIARIVLGAGGGDAVTRAGRKRQLESVPRPPAPVTERSAPERLPAVHDPVDPVIRWTIAQGGLRPDELLTVEDTYVFDRLLGFRGLLNQEGHTFACLGERWMEENREEVSHQSDAGSFFQELFLFMLAESRADEALSTGVEYVDPVIKGVILRGGLRPDTLHQLSDEEQRKVRHIPAIIAPRGLTWLEHARAHYQDVEVFERHHLGLPFDAVTVDDFIEVFRYALDYSGVNTQEESLPVSTRRRTPPHSCSRGTAREESLPYRVPVRRGPPSLRVMTEHCPVHRPSRGGATVEQCPAERARTPGSTRGCGDAEGHSCPAPRGIQGRR